MKLFILVAICIVVAQARRGPKPCKRSNQGSRHYNLTPCASIGTIRDECGNVVKGACQIATGYSYDDAIQACRNYGMNLFVAENQAIYNSFMQYIGGQFSQVCSATWNSDCGLWIGGKKSGSPPYSAIKDYSSITMDTSFYSFITGGAGDCIVIKRDNSVFKVSDWPCSQPYWIICEFDNTYGQCGHDSNSSGD